MKSVLPWLEKPKLLIPKKNKKKRNCKLIYLIYTGPRHKNYNKILAKQIQADF